MPEIVTVLMFAGTTVEYWSDQFACWAEVICPEAFRIRIPLAALVKLPCKVTEEDSAENGLDALTVTPSPEDDEPPPLEDPQETPKQTGVPKPVV